MATLPSIDRSLSRTSSWMSYVAFAGLLVLAFLPGNEPPQKPVAPRAAMGVAPSSLAKALPAAPTPAVTTTPAAPSTVATPSAPGVAPTTPPPDLWTPEELASGLRKCLQLLAPAATEIELQEPMKHGQCGTPAPLVLHSIGTAEKVEFSPAPTMNCRLAASLAEWVEKVLQPAAQKELGSRIKKIVGSSSYSCRNIYNNPKLSLSEHATGNAIDISGFMTADGRTVYVSKSWGPTVRDIEAAKKKAAAQNSKDKSKAEGSTETGAITPTPSIEEAGKKAEAKDKGKVVKANFKKEEPAKGDGPKAEPAAPGTVAPATTKEATFLKALHHASCTVFATVLGPEANEAHRDHFHLDMKLRNSGASVCH